MKKIGIITITSKNFGNRLQNYALQKVLERLGFQVETIFGENKQSLTQRIKTVVKRLIIIINHDKYIYDQRIMKFNRFDRKYINKSKIIREKITPEDSSKYDYFVCGSDQIWNYSFDFINEFYFAAFAPQSKKIAYAASFGVNDIVEPYTSRYSEWLNDFKAISVREQRGCEIIRRLTGRNAEVVVDPTLLLSQQEWLEIAELPKGVNYILVYFLGNLEDDVKESINKWGSDNGLKTVEITNGSAVSPEEFIGFIKQSRLVITDSFHACVFSVIMHIPFVACDRKDNKMVMSSRIDTLLSTLGLQSRKYINIKSKNALKIDYSHVDEIIDTEKAKANKYLKEVLEIE